MNAMKTTYSNFPLLQKGYPTPFWIASAGSASTMPAFSIAQLLSRKSRTPSWVAKRRHMGGIMLLVILKALVMRKIHRLLRHHSSTKTLSQQQALSRISFNPVSDSDTIFRL